MLTVAMTGATGFVGRHALAAAAARGVRVRALTRRAQDEMAGVAWVAGSLTDADSLARLVQGADVVLHIAGATNAADAAGFAQANVLGTAFVRRAAGALPLVAVSSLSAREPQLSLYGASKLRGEQVAMGAAGPVCVVRPPAVYGPGDTEFLPLFRAARRGVVPVPAGARASMIYGADLGDALVALAGDLCGAGKAAGRVLDIDDGAGGYDQRVIARAIADAAGSPALVLPLGAGLIRAAAAVDVLLAKPGGRLPKLSHDRARYFAHRDWSCDAAALLELGIWRPKVGLVEGMALTGEAYRAAGLL